MKASRNSKRCRLYDDIMMILHAPNFGILNVRKVFFTRALRTRCSCELNILVNQPTLMRHPQVPQSDKGQLVANGGTIWHCCCANAQRSSQILKFSEPMSCPHSLSLSLTLSLSLCTWQQPASTARQEKWFSWEPLNPLPGRLGHLGQSRDLLPGPLDHSVLTGPWLIKIQHNFAGVSWWTLPCVCVFF